MGSQIENLMPSILKLYFMKSFGYYHTGTNTRFRIANVVHVFIESSLFVIADSEPA